MALTISSIIASANSVTSSTSLVVSGVNAAIGDLLILGVAADNAGAAGAASLATNAVTDSGGNTWVNQGGIINRTQAGAASDGATLGLWTCLVTAPLSAGSVTIAFTTATVAKAAAIKKVTGTSPQIYAVGPGVTGSNTIYSTGNVAVPAGGTMMGWLAFENSNAPGDDTDTTNGTWSTGENALASTGVVGTSQCIYLQQKTVTAAGNQSWDPSTGGARDFALNYIILFDASPAALAAAGQGAATIAGGASVAAALAGAGVGAASLSGNAILRSALAGAGVGSASFAGGAIEGAALAAAGLGGASFTGGAVLAAVLAGTGAGAGILVGRSFATIGAVTAAGHGAAALVSHMSSAGALRASGLGRAHLVAAGAGRVAADIRRVYASAPSGQRYVETLELRHPAFPQTFFINNSPQTWTFDLGDGTQQAFAPVPFKIALPTQDGKGQQDLQVVIDNVGRDAMEAIELAALQPQDPIEITVRIYLNIAGSAPQNSPPLKLTLSEVEVTTTAISGTAGRADTLNRVFPSVLYRTDTFPGLNR